MEDATGKEEELQKFLGKVDEIGIKSYLHTFDSHWTELVIAKR